MILKLYLILSYSKKSKKMPTTISEELLDTYIRSEFNAMDTDHDGKLNRQQVLDLLIMLGYSKGKEKLKVSAYFFIETNVARYF